MLFTELTKQPKSAAQVNGNSATNLRDGQTKCIGILLAGGLSSRMGTNKAQLVRPAISNEHGTRSQSFQAQSMLAFSAQLLLDAGVDQLIVSANASQAAQLTNEIGQLFIRQHSIIQADTSSQAGTSQVGMGEPKVVTDLTPKLGPLGGIYSVLEQIPCQAALILPVDLPLMTSDALRTLKQAGELNHQATMYRHHMLPLYLPNNGYTELFFKQHFRALAASASQAPVTDNGKTTSPIEKTQGASIKTLLSQLPHQSIECTAPNLLTNTNTPEDWQHAQSQLLSPRRSF